MLTITRAITGVAVATVMLAGMACQPDEKAGEIVPVPDSAPETIPTSTTLPAPTEAPSPTTTTTVYDWGPVICPGVGHPAHHEPCHDTRARAPEATHDAPSPQARTSGWAIPDYIVACESGGSWTAENASGAAGPYQLMPEHFGGESALNQSPAAQHAKAAELWDGGRGASHWEQCL